MPPDKKKEQYLMDTKTINNNESLYKSFQALHLQMWTWYDMIPAIILVRLVDNNIKERNIPPGCLLLEPWNLITQRSYSTQ